MDFRVSKNNLNNLEENKAPKLDIKPTKKPIVLKNLIKNDNISLSKYLNPPENKAVLKAVTPQILNHLSSPECTKPDISTDSLANRVESLYNRFSVKSAEKVNNLKEVISGFKDDQKEVFACAVEQLENIKDNKADSSDYMINILKKSSELAGNNSQKFIQLVGEVFSEKEGSFDFFRKVLGAGSHKAGNILEPLLVEIISEGKGAGVEAGFNSNMTDDIDRNNTMTHHYGEFIQVGFHRGETLGKIASFVIDTPYIMPSMTYNNGDVRSGYFASMLGDGLRDKKIKPADVVKLTQWAYTNEHNGLKDPPFGRVDKDEFMNWSQYKIDKWIKDYNQAFPDDPINT